jgi:hypothetical protein
MSCIRRIILLSAVFYIVMSLNADAKVVRILTVGNSITYDETTYDVEPNIRPAGLEFRIDTGYTNYSPKQAIPLIM